MISFLLLLLSLLYVINDIDETYIMYQWHCRKPAHMFFLSTPIQKITQVFHFHSSLSFFIELIVADEVGSTTIDTTLTNLWLATAEAFMQVWFFYIVIS